MPLAQAPPYLIASYSHQKTRNKVDYTKYKEIEIDIKPNGVALLTLNRPEKFNVRFRCTIFGSNTHSSFFQATNARAHREASEIWLDIGRDPNVKVALITGKGKAFSAGGDMDMIEDIMFDEETWTRNHEEARNIVWHMVRPLA